MSLQGSPEVVTAASGRPQHRIRGHYRGRAVAAGTGARIGTLGGWRGGVGEAKKAGGALVDPHGGAIGRQAAASERGCYLVEAELREVEWHEGSSGMWVTTVGGVDG